MPRNIYSSPYSLSPAADSILLGSGAALFGLSLYTGQNIEPLTDREIEKLSKNDINRFDRSAADNWSTSADNWSTMIVLPLMASPTAFLIDNETRNDIFTIGGHVHGITAYNPGVLNGTVKNTFQRNRPLYL